MSNQITVIEKKFVSTEVLNELASALGFALDDLKGKEAAKKYAMSVIAEIRRTAGDEKKDLTNCNLESIVQAAVDAARFRLYIDGRKQAHLIKYLNNVQFQIGVAGYVAKIHEHLPSAVISAEVVYEGDTLDTVDTDGYESYTFRRKNNFENDINKIVGAFAVVSYNVNGKRVQHVEKMPRSDIDKIRGKARQDYIWREWFTEKAKVAVIRRACKIPFQGIQGLQELLEYDNKNYDLDRAPEAPAAQDRNIVDNLNDVIEGNAVEVSEEKKTFTLTTRKGGTAYETVEDWEKACFDLINKLNKLEQFAVFVQKNGIHFDEVAKINPEVTKRLNNYMVERQYNLQKQADNEGAKT